MLCFCFLSFPYSFFLSLSFSLSLILSFSPSSSFSLSLSRPENEIVSMVWAANFETAKTLFSLDFDSFLGQSDISWTTFCSHRPIFNCCIEIKTALTNSMGDTSFEGCLERRFWAFEVGIKLRTLLSATHFNHPCHPWQLKCSRVTVAVLLHSFVGLSNNGMCYMCAFCVLARTQINSAFFKEQSKHLLFVFSQNCTRQLQSVFFTRTFKL